MNNIYTNSQNYNINQTYMSGRNRPTAENIITSFREGNKMVVVWFNQSARRGLGANRERRMIIGGRQFKRLARQGVLNLQDTDYRLYPSGYLVNYVKRDRNYIKRIILKWRDDDDTLIKAIPLGKIGVNDTLNLIVETLYGENVKVRVDDVYYTLNDYNVSRLIYQIQNGLISEVADGITESDEKFQYVLNPVDDIYLVKPNYVAYDVNGNPLENPQGSFFKWLNKTNICLHRQGIFSRNIHIDEHKKELNINCLIRALKNGGMSDIKLNKMKTFVFNRSVPMCRLKQICNILEIQIKIKKVNDNNTYRYGAEFEEKYILGLIEGHYFIIEKVPITSYALKYYWTLKDKEDWNKIVDNRNHKRNDRFMNSFNVIKYMCENKKYYLSKINFTFDLLNTQFYSSIENETITNLHYSKKYDTELNEWDIEKEEWRKNQPKPIKVFFDFETDVNQEHHKPFICCKLDEFGIDGAYFNSYDMSGNCKYNCGERFLESLGDDGDSYLLIAHNAGYDYRFIVEYLQQDKQVSSGVSSFFNSKSKYWNFRLNKYIDIEIKDSYKLITMPLRKFGKCFNLRQEKEVMPYSLYTEENIKKRIMPISSALVHLKNSEKDLKQLEENCKKWGIFCRIGGVDCFDIMKYSVKYCALDCEILKNGYEIFRGWLVNSFDLDIDGIWTIASLADKYLMKNGVYEGVYKLSGIPRAFIQNCVVGGRTMVSENKKKIIDISGCEIADYDGVSLYPSSFQRMGDAGGVLKGTPKIIKNLNYEFLKSVDGYFCVVKITRVGINRKFPLASVVDENGVRVFRNDIVGQELYVDKYALEDLIEFQDVDFEVIRGYYYDEGRNPKIKEVIEFLFNERLKKKAEHNPIQIVYKLIMNASYGKSILKPITTEIKIIDGENNLNKFVQKNYNRITEYNEITTHKLNSKVKKYRVKLIVPIKNHFNNCVLGVECLSMSKRIMNEVICLGEDNGLNIFYQDTDSLHIFKSDVAILETAYLEKYNRVLTGKQLGQFHIDFDLEDENGNECSDIVAYKSIFLGKKCYIDMLKGVAENGDIVKGIHIRMKGVPNTTIYHTAKKYSSNEDINEKVYNLYKKLYYGVRIPFDLLEFDENGISQRVNFKCKKDMTICSMKEFTRFIHFAK